MHTPIMHLKLRLPVLYSLMLSIVSTAALIAIVTQPNMILMPLVELSTIWLIMNIVALTGVHMYEVKQANTKERVLGLLTICAALLTVLSEIGLTVLYFLQKNTQIVELVTMILALCSVLLALWCVCLHFFTHKVIILRILGILASIAGTVALALIVAVQFVTVPLGILLVRSSVTTTIVCLLLLPLVQYTLYTRKRLKNS